MGGACTRLNIVFSSIYYKRAGLCSVVVRDSWPRLACVQ